MKKPRILKCIHVKYFALLICQTHGILPYNNANLYLEAKSTSAAGQESDNIQRQVNQGNVKISKLQLMLKVASGKQGII